MSVHLTSSDQINCVQVVAGLHPSEGGITRTVVQLSDALATRSDVSVSIYSQGLINQPTFPNENHRVKRVIPSSPSSRLLKMGLPFRKELFASKPPVKSTVIHANGIWSPVHYWSSHFARRRNLPLVSQVHGMLEPWAIGYKSLKKKLALSVYQKAALDSSSVLVATSVAEYENIRALGFTKPIAIIPNGISFPRAELIANNKAEKSVRKMLFLSRINVKKGLLNLLAAWSIVKPSGWRLQLVGPDEDNHLSQVYAAAKELGIENDIDYLGELDGIEKEQVYLSADIFVLPTFSENFGVVVAEALSYGLPVITTKGAPWSDLQKFSCGWWIDIGVPALVAALSESTSLTNEERIEMGKRGQNYVLRYDWLKISEQFCDLYQWLLNEESKPDTVKLE